MSWRAGAQRVARLDDDGSAGDAAKYDDAHTDDDDHGGCDDDNMSDFSGNNSLFRLMSSTVVE